MLRLMLNVHPDVVIPSETWFLIDLMNAFPLTATLSESDKERAVTVISSHVRWKDLDIETSTLRDRVQRLVRPQLADVIHAVYAELMAAAGKKRWGDKTPEYVLEIERLSTIFPGAQFIHLIRDARDVSLSLMKKRWRGTLTINAARYWSTYVRRGMELGRKLPKEQYLEVNYEDLVLHPEVKLREVCEFLGLEFRKELLQFHESASDKIPQRERRFHTNTSRPPQADDVQRWRTEASAIQVLAVEAAAGSTMDQVGQARHFRGISRILPAVLGGAESLLWGVLRIRRQIRPAPTSGSERR